MTYYGFNFQWIFSWNGHPPAAPAALRWFSDLLSLYQQYRWGYALWNFEGAFGIVDHARSGARFEDLHGYRVDRDLLELLEAHRV
ncbi:MAG: hypothetical protein SF123_11965 [Chloroflexota bacterium]|nr:hypothetical protein [Chloroflexota bacterium]